MTDALLQIFDGVWTQHLLIAACIALPSGMIQGYVGFGGALFAAPLFAFLFEPVTAFSTLVILMLFSQSQLLPEALRRADWKEIAPVSASSVAAMSIGIFFLRSTDPAFIRRGMGVLILLMTVVMMFGYRYSGKRRTLIGVATGSTGGAISGFFGVPAFPLSAMFLHSADCPPAAIRANVLTAICCTLVAYVIVLSLHGVYNATTLARAALLAPIFTLGVHSGASLFRIAPAEWFKKVTYGVLICTALALLVA